MVSDNEGAVSGRTDWIEQPTAAAVLHIVLGVERGRPPRPSGLPTHQALASNWWRVRSASAPGDAVLTALTAFYLAAEQAMQPDEPSFDVDRGLQRFSAWLDDHTEP